jgi:hypothetical protein
MRTGVGPAVERAGVDQFLDKYYPDADRADVLVVYAYMEAQTLEY